MAESNIKLRVDARQAEQSLRRVNSLVGKLGAALGAADIARRFFKGFVEADNAAAAVSTLGVNADKLKQKLLSLSAEQKGLVSQTDLLAASYDVASAGFNSAAQATDVLRAASLGAVGGLSDLNTVANATTSVLNAYGLESSKAQKLVDGFIQTQNDGKIIVAQYAAQIGRVAPTAAAAGVGIDELNAAISAVTATGVPVESTFAGIRQVIAGVIKPTAEAAERAKELGIDFSTAAIRTKGFGGFLEDLIEKTGGSEVELSKMFSSVEALTALMPLVNDRLGKFNSSLENQRDSFGVAKKAAEEMGGTVSGQIKAIVNNAGNLTRTLDEGLGPVIREALAPMNTILAQSVDLFSKIPPQVVTFTAKITALTAAAVILRKVMLLTFLARLPQLLTVVNGKMVALKFATIKLKTAMLGLKAALPFGAAIIAADLLVGKILDLQQAQKDFNDLVKQGGRAEIEAASAALDARRQVLEAKLEPLKGKKGRSAQGLRNRINVEIGAIDDKQARLLERLDQLDLEDAAKPKPPKVKTDTQDLQDIQDPKALKALNDRKFDAFAVEAEHIRRMAEEEEARNAAEGAALGKRLQLGADLIEQTDRQIELIQARAKGNEAEVRLKHRIADINKQDLEPADKAALIAKEQQLHLLSEQAKATEELNSFYQSVSDTIQSGIVNGIMSAIDGSKSLKESLSGLLKQVGGMFLNRAVGGLMPQFAEGGYVSGPTTAVIGEGGEPEYVIPESKMRESMARYSRGSRGAGVIPENGGGGSEDGGAVATAAPIDVRFSVERINSVDYVTADQFQAGMQQAATQGAKQGEQQTLKRLKMSGSTRKRIGM
jgi:TP901 family phage tail tape measure protein